MFTNELIMLADDSGYFGVAYEGEPVKAFAFNLAIKDLSSVHATINEESARQLLEFLETHLNG